MRLVFLTVGFYLIGILIFGCGHDVYKKIQGPAGKQGDPGVGGTGSEGPQGLPGKIGPVGNTGPAGQRGEIGETGPQGSVGASCSVVQLEGGALITCGDSEAVILNGESGTDGTDGQDAPMSDFEVIGLVDPCGPQSQFDEVFLQLANGDLIAHYASGNKQFLTIIDPGFTYITTDGTHCVFSVDAQGVIYDEHN